MDRWVVWLVLPFTLIYHWSKLGDGRQVHRLVCALCDMRTTAQQCLFVLQLEALVFLEDKLVHICWLDLRSSSSVKRFAGFDRLSGMPKELVCRVCISVYVSGGQTSSPAWKQFIPPWQQRAQCYRSLICC